MTTTWIFGATGLSGRAIARELLRDGADVVLVGRDGAKLASVGRSIGESANQRVVSGLTELIELIGAEKPDVVVNAAGR
jgi:short subunit dehydrogenase-like uncharacterized protein